jgi:phospholipid/cholesterol/gamma-HCH transport system substrate-binding protein
LLALSLAGGAVALTGLNLVRGGLIDRAVPVVADFSNCGQGLRVGGDVKLRGVLVGRISSIHRLTDGDARCQVELGLNPETLDQIPGNAGAQIRAKTVFGEKWVELLYPEDPAPTSIAHGDTIGHDRTIDPLEVETILNTALPLLDAIDPEHLAGALTALADAFTGHEDAAIRAMTAGSDALDPVIENRELLEKGIRQLAESGKLLEDVSPDLMAALDNLDQVNRFTIGHRDLIETSLSKAPLLLDELSELFDTRIQEFATIANQGATVLGVLAARDDDLQRLLSVLPRFNSAWIRNLNHVCRHRQETDEPGQSRGERVPGRCWRVHNVLSESRGAYGRGEAPRPRNDNRSSNNDNRPSNEEFRSAGLDEITDVGKVLYMPAVVGGAR